MPAFAVFAGWERRHIRRGLVLWLTRGCSRRPESSSHGSELCGVARGLRTSPKVCRGDAWRLIVAIGLGRPAQPRATYRTEGTGGQTAGVVGRLVVDSARQTGLPMRHSRRVRHAKSQLGMLPSPACSHRRHAKRPGVVHALVVIHDLNWRADRKLHHMDQSRPLDHDLHKTFGVFLFDQQKE